MLRKIFSITVLSLAAMSGLFSAQLEYDIQDIGTLQTKASEAIAINNRGQILGWYNIDGTNTGKHFFVRDRDGSFHELPKNEKASGWEINWRFLTDDGKAYGTFDGNANYSVLYLWDQFNDVVKLGNLPNKEIVAINNVGQVLIKSVVENENGRSMRRPAIWQNGQITKLRGLEGDIGIESEESYGIDMNNNGEVVGHSQVLLSHKNTLYTQIHATKWVRGQAIDLHDEVPKSPNSYAHAINDLGDVIVGSELIRIDGKTIQMHTGPLKSTDKNYFYKGMSILDRNGNKVSDINNIGDIFHYDKSSIWWAFEGIVSLNDSGEILSRGTTVWGEQHAMLLTPIRSE